MILELESIGFSYAGSEQFINDLSFSIGEGEFIGLLGANGSGKSTILKIGSGILKPLSGELRLWGKTMQTYKNRDRAKLISYLPQTLDVNVPFSVSELVDMGLYPYDIPPAMTVEDALKLVGLEDKAEAYITDLSGGERRRTFIAMTLVQGAGLLLLDEPLANLDIKYQIELLRLLKRLKEKRNISIVMALHDINIALQFEKVMLVKDGSILGIGTPESLLTDIKIKEAFDINIEIKRSDTGHTFLSYEDNF
jgi:iron complex transport system ATP-binding protein